MSVTRFIHRNGQTAPAAGDLEVAEVAIDTLTGSAYTKDENGNVVQIGREYDDSDIIDDLAFEADERKAADAKIEADLQALDLTLNAGLTAETLARSNADSALSDRIDDLEGASSGPGMVISEDEPEEADRVTGMQWLDVSGDDAQVWIWDEDKWVEFPAAGHEAYDDTQVMADIAANAADIVANAAEIDTKLDADTIWTGTQDEYDALVVDADTLYFITA